MRFPKASLETARRSERRSLRTLFFSPRKIYSFHYRLKMVTRNIRTLCYFLVESVLLGALSVGINKVLCLSGDQPGENGPAVVNEFNGNGLIELCKVIAGGTLSDGTEIKNPLPIYPGAADDLYTQISKSDALAAARTSILLNFLALSSLVATIVASSLQPMLSSLTTSITHLICRISLFSQ